MSQSKKLTEFYNAYNNWLNAGAPNYEPFSRTAGLCYGIMTFSDENCKVARILKSEMRKQFDAADLDNCTPFNNDENYYADESDDRSMHLNPKRIEWVRSHLS